MAPRQPGMYHGHRDRRPIGLADASGQSAFGAVPEIVALSSTPRTVWPAEEDDCKSSIPGGNRGRSTVIAIGGQWASLALALQYGAGKGEQGTYPCIARRARRHRLRRADQIPPRTRGRARLGELQYPDPDWDRPRDYTPLLPVAATRRRLWLRHSTRCKGGGETGELAALRAVRSTSPPERTGFLPQDR